MTPDRQAGRAAAIIFVAMSGSIAWAADTVPGEIAEPEPETAAPSSWKDNLIDPEDGYLDVSGWLEKPFGFFPVVIPVTEPAVGYGVGGAAVFLKENALPPGPGSGSGSDSGPEYIPPDISAVGGLATENGSWGVFGAYLGSWSQDRLRTETALGHVDLNLSFYGDGGGMDEIGDDPMEYNIEVQFLSHNFKWRIPETKAFFGLGYTFLNTDVRFVEEGKAVDLGLDLLKSRDAGLNFALEIDTRDNHLNAERGFYLGYEASVYDENLGGDFGYWRHEINSLNYWEPHPKFILGVRAEGKFTTGAVPFYALPYIDLRGIPALRYQGDSVLTGEVEGKYKFHPRYALVGFGGLGSAVDDWDLFGDGDTSAWSYGAGIRYLVSRKFGLSFGIDVARGPEDTAVYFQFGSSWDTF